MNRPLALVLALLLGATVARADCYPFDKAAEHVGEIVCIRGQVVSVNASPGGTHYLNFCADYRGCPFTVVVFASKLDQIGDVRSLEKQEIEIDGLVKLYNGQPEIVLSELDQLHGKAASHIPPLPKHYDVSVHGNYSAGHFSGKSLKRSKTKRVPQDQTDPMSDFSTPQ